MSNTPPGQTEHWLSRVPSWWGVAAAVIMAIAAFAHLESATAENTRQIGLLWPRVHEFQVVAVDIAAIKAHSEDTEKRIDQIDAKMDRLIEQRVTAPVALAHLTQ